MISPSLSIIQWNARSLYRAKLDLFKYNLRISNPSVVLLSETHWVDSHPVAFTAYNCFSKNRTGKCGGGVAILVKKSLSAYLFNTPSLDHFESIGISIHLANGKKLNLISVYCPKGDAPPSEINSLFSSCEGPFSIGGDFNAHHSMLKDSHNNNTCGVSITNHLSSDNNLVLCTPTNLPTRIDPSSGIYSTIDLTFSSADIGHLIQISSGPSTWDSDHIPIQISVNLTSPTTYKPPPTWKFDNNKWGLWNERILDRLTERHLQDLVEVSEAYQTWHDIGIEISKEVFTFAVRGSRSKEPCRPWWSPEIKQAIARSKRAKLLWTRSPCPDNKTELNRLDAIKKKFILKSKANYSSSYISALESGKQNDIWRFAKKLRGSGLNSSPPYPITDPSGAKVTSTEEIADMFHSFLSEHISSSPTCPGASDKEAFFLDKVDSAINSETLNSLNNLITTSELHSSLQNLKSRAIGTDTVHNDMLTNLNQANR